MSGRSAHLFLLLALGTWLSAGCSAPVKYYECGNLDDEPRIDARAVWDCNRDVMKHIVNGKKFSLREFRGAAEFFEELTGIPADVRRGRSGPMPGPRLPDNLRAWDHWYRNNGEHLVWDPETSSIRLVAAGES